MPIYEYRCSNEHLSSKICSHAASYEPHVCPRCGEIAERQFPMSHVEPDGIYSYAPNIGTEQDYERRRTAIREGQRVIKREA